MRSTGISSAGWARNRNICGYEILKHEWNRYPVGARHDLRKWVVSRGSLTDRIRSKCGNFSVRHVVNRFAPANRDECRRIGLARKTEALIREVFLCCGETPVVFAHSVSARRSLKGPWRSLKYLGHQSLGSTLLSSPEVKRDKLEFCTITKHHPLHKKACGLMDCSPRKFWARRSLFRRGRNSILVTEIFLPDILELP